MESVKSLRKEYMCLNNKLSKLNTFIYSKEFDDISVEDKKLLTKQASYMHKYWKILLDRIKLHDEEYFTICETCGKLLNYYDKMAFDGEDCYFCIQCANIDNPVIQSNNIEK